MSKNNISDVHTHKYMKIKINWENDLHLEKILNMHDVVGLIKSVFSKNHNHYYHQHFLEKRSNK